MFLEKIIGIFQHLMAFFANFYINLTAYKVIYAIIEKIFLPF